jgi:hypothetical protein
VGAQGAMPDRATFDKFLQNLTWICQVRISWICQVRKAHPTLTCKARISWIGNLSGAEGAPYFNDFYLIVVFEFFG